MNSRETRRQLGVLCKRLPEAKLGTLTDPRRRQGRRWSLRALLRAVLIGLVAGAKSLKDVESLSDDMSHATRKLMALRGRVPDTTLRNVLVRLMPDELRRCLHHQVRKAHRRKALAPTDLPFGIVALDGRSTTLKVKKGSQSGAIFTMKAKGIKDLRSGRRGNQLVQVVVEVPRKLTKKQEELLRSFAETEEVHVTPQRKSFFDKIKDYFEG